MPEFPDVPETAPAEPSLRTLCNQEERKLEVLISKLQAYEQQRDTIIMALSELYNSVLAQRAYVSGLRVALGDAPLPNALPALK